MGGRGDFCSGGGWSSPPRGRAPARQRTAPGAGEAGRRSRRRTGRAGRPAPRLRRRAAECLRLNALPGTEACLSGDNRLRLAAGIGALLLMAGSLLTALQPAEEASSWSGTVTLLGIAVGALMLLSLFLQ